MEHREEMNCGGDLCKEMLDVGDGQIAARKQQPRDDGWYTYDWMYTFSDTLLLLTCKKTDVIAIMRAIINKPQIQLADEPTGNLDKENSQTIMNLLERLNKQGMTIVMVTHDTSLAKYGTRGGRVEDGRIIEKGKEILK